jgi:hypothetical protein
MLPAGNMETPAMILGLLRPVRVGAGWAALLGACAVATACSSNTPAAPDAFIAATMGPGTDSPNSICNLGSTQQWLDVGVPTTGTNLPKTVKDGDSQNGSPVSVNCSVTTSGGGFDISLNIIMEGTGGGSLTITSPAGQGAVTDSGGSGISVQFQSATNGAFNETDCTLTYTYNGETVPDNPPIAAGRIWGHIECPKAISSGTTVTGPDGGLTARQCDGKADFLFEQCGQ